MAVYDLKEGTRRLAVVLYNSVDDAHKVECLARLLGYDEPKQLSEDIYAFCDRLTDLECMERYVSEMFVPDKKA